MRALRIVPVLSVCYGSEAECAEVGYHEPSPEFRAWMAMEHKADGNMTKKDGMTAIERRVDEIYV